MRLFSHDNPGRNRTALSVSLLAAGMLAAFAPSAAGADADNGKSDAGVDTMTSASVDATTGASKQVAEITVGGSFSVAYAVNYDGALFIMAPNLTDAYQRDELASDALFKGKDMVVKGTVEKTSKPDARKPWITLVGDDASKKKIRCALAPGGLDGKKAEPGATVQVRGTCEGMKLSISLSDARILD